MGKTFVSKILNNQLVFSSIDSVLLLFVVICYYFLIFGNFFFLYFEIKSLQMDRLWQPIAYMEYHRKTYMFRMCKISYTVYCRNMNFYVQ